MEKVYLTNNDVEVAAKRVADQIWQIAKSPKRPGILGVFGVPRGGVPVAYLVRHYLPPTTIVVDVIANADVIVDDIIGTGATRTRYTKHGLPFFALCSQEEGKWVVFPWEKEESAEDRSTEDIFVRLLQYIGEDPTREGLRETPARMAKAWKEWAAGYNQDPKSVLKMFEDGGEGYNEMLIERDIPFYSHCEHHLAPFFGTATIAYIPNRKIVGVSKLGRVLHIFSRRLQVQERLTTSVADCLYNEAAPKGVGVVIKARHLCKESRGIAIQGSFTVTSALRGVFLTEPAVRAEFLSLAR